MDFKKTMYLCLLSLMIFTLLIGCHESDQTTYSESVNEESSNASSDAEPTSVSIITPSPTPEMYNIQSIDAKRVLDIFPANDAVVVMGNESYLTIDGEILPDIADLERRGRVDYSANNESMGLLFQKRGGNSDVLVFTDGKNAIDVTNNVLDFHVSYDGKRVAYRVRTNEYDPTVSAQQYDPVIGGFYDPSLGALYVFDTESKESILISEYAGEQYALSPSGSAIGFMKIINWEDPEDWTCLYGVIGDEYVNTGIQEFPVALTDDASLVYVMQRDSTKYSLGVYNLGTRALLSSELLHRGNRMFIFNADCTEVLINDEAGVLYSSQGEEANLIEPSYAIYLEKELASKSDDLKSFLRSNDLGDHLYILSSDFGYSKMLWHLRGDETAIQLLTIAEGKWNSECTYKRVDTSVLFGNSEEMILAENIDDPNNLQTMPISSVSTQEFLLTSNQTVYYFSADETTKAVYSAGLEKYDTRLYEMSALYPESRENPVVISSTCVYMERQARENQPDMIYYLEYVEPQSSRDEYKAWKYNHLYAMEDLPGAEPVLLAENVSEIGIGEFGVFYVQLNKVGSGSLDWYRDHEYTGSLRDTVDVFFSSDGQSFEKIATVGREYLIWSGS